ncbi:hypothetical protein BC643_4362 [Mangrovibacterium diazotrophicum]|uniref:Uncharacterized protein n=1 Tax=Mangrovibacterium diazotrophicum TaxID=1261403 RepID=A0A419VVG0_9BACT|nr:hypothetical protein BC643_4362 [Mangrovibacterium diazotrophicum]
MRAQKYHFLPINKTNMLYISHLQTFQTLQSFILQIQKRQKKEPDQVARLLLIA